MTVAQLKEFAELFGKGFRPYTGEILPVVYERRECKDPSKAYWICKWPILHCFGCHRRCTPKSAEGFQVMLPEEVKSSRPKLTPAEIMAAKHFLRVDEAAYCLNVSTRKIYSMAAEGKLIAHVDKPLRITVESVKAEMERVDI